MRHINAITLNRPLPKRAQGLLPDNISLFGQFKLALADSLMQISPSERLDRLIDELFTFYA